MAGQLKKELFFAASLKKIGQLPTARPDKYGNVVRVLCKMCADVGYCTVEYNGTRKTRPCMTNHPVVDSRIDR